MMDIKRVINATGVVIHTNLGRSPLPEGAMDLITNNASRYFPLEYDLKKGERGHRDRLVQDLLCELTGAEMTTVANNNAGGILLTLNTLAGGGEVLVSRGELIEIGGSFRLPEVIKASGCILKRVGNVNKTTIDDYRDVVTDRTNAILTCHRSNFYIEGEDVRPDLEELVSLSGDRGLPLIYDEGSGTFTGKFSDAPTVKDALEMGVDIVLASGDKLLGGPQAGLILGKAEYIERIRKNHLLRALRVGKLTYLALYHTLTLYKEGRFEEIPTWRLLMRGEDELRVLADDLANRLNEVLDDKGEAWVGEGASRVGGGTLPGFELPTFVVVVEVEGLTPHQLGEAMRDGDVPVIGRITDDGFVLDVRTLLEGDVGEIAGVVGEVV